MWFWRLWHILFHESPRGHRCRGVMTDKNGPPTSTDWWRECQSLRAELERVRSNHVTVAEEIQRRHDACAPLIAEIERLRAALEKIEAGYSHQRLSAAELASIARQAL
jgi:septal ring factor EnvC (AmiA/AmiB activator)